MNQEDFEKAVEQGIKAVPEKFLKKLKNVDICVENEPSFQQMKKIRIRKDSLIFGLYEGIPLTKRTHYAQVLPEKITIFKKPIERVAYSKEKIREIIKNTVWHEIAHHFGMNEKQVREAEKRKRDLSTF